MCAALCRSLAFFRVQTKQKVMTWSHFSSVTPSTSLPSLMFCSGDADQKRSVCFRLATEHALQQALRRCAAPCQASLQSQSCWTPPARAFVTSCCPVCSPVVGPSLFALNCARCLTTQPGTLGVLCSEN